MSKSGSLSVLSSTVLVGIVALLIWKWALLRRSPGPSELWDIAADGAMW
jgi:hypothetical protein